MLSYGKKIRVALNIFEIILVGLICCYIIASTNLSQAKLLTTSNTNENSGNVAKFIFLSSPSTSKELTIDCRTDKTKNTWTANYPFSVSNSKGEQVSEVTIEYEILITIPSPLTNGITLSLTGNNSTLTPKQTTSTTFLFDGYSEFIANDSSSHSYNIVFTVNATVVVDVFELDEITININSKQVD